MTLANRFNRPLLLYTAENPTETPGFLLSIRKYKDFPKRSQKEKEKVPVHKEGDFMQNPLKINYSKKA